MLEISTGRNYLLAPALLAGIRAALDEGEGTIYVVVPKQLTLQTELDLLAGLNLRGSFRLQILSPERLCSRIFDAAGRPEGTRVDERGRVMLARAAAKSAHDGLTLYKGAEQRRGFSERAARQLELVRQAGLTPRELSDMADAQTGVMAYKLRDLARLLEEYEKLIEGRFQDGEAEFAAAVERAKNAKFLRESRFWFFGFDLMPPPLHDLIVAVAAECPYVNVLFPLQNDPLARDVDVFLPLQASFERLCARAKAMEVDLRRTRLEPDASTPPRHPELVHLEREIYSWPAQVWQGPEVSALGAQKKSANGGENAPAQPRAIQLAVRKNPAEEAAFVAALARRLAQTRGFKWNDMLVLCADMEAYSRPLTEAFAAYEVPVFLSTSRPASRHALAECLITALSAAANNFRTDDMLTLMRTGYMDIDPDEADRFANYITQHGLRGKNFLRPLERGDQSLCAALEPVRERLVAPLVKLQDALSAAQTLREQLTAVFGFLTDISAYEKSVERQQDLQADGLRQLAGEEAQVWTRILGALDQMDALMGEKKLARRELGQLLKESLEAAIIKPLPQSGDAVSAQPLDRITAKRARAVFLVGLTDRVSGGDEGLLSDAQRSLLAEISGRYVGLSAMDTARTRRFYLKTALGMATDYVCFTYPLSGADDAAERPHPVIGAVREIFPGLTERGGVSADAGLDQMLRGAPDAAVTHIARALTGGGNSGKTAAPGGSAGTGSPDDADVSALAALSALPDAHDALLRLQGAMDRRRAADSLSRATAERLYGVIRRASISRLERFAACPFAHYVQYGLEPEVVEPYKLTARDEGDFYHDAVRAFLAAHGRTLPEMTAGEAEAAMGALADRLLDELALGPLGESAVSRADRRRLRATACTAAGTLREHLSGSSFAPGAVEVRFGQDDGDARLILESRDGDCILEGRIDRLDIAPAIEDEDEEEDLAAAAEGGESAPDGEIPPQKTASPYVRVIDYKRGNRAPDPTELFGGLQLQLPVYLGAAMRSAGAESAGAYYFRVDEGLVTTQSSDEKEVEAARRKKLRMSGILPQNTHVLRAMADDPGRVVKGLAASGAPLAATISADKEGFDLIVGNALDRARSHIEGIRSGLADVSPARTRKFDPCAWCSWRPACLRDESIDARACREFKTVKASELVDAIRKRMKE